MKYPILALLVIVITLISLLSGCSFLDGKFAKLNDDQIISLVLTQHYTDSGYDMINPEMSLVEASEQKDNAIDSFKKQGHDFSGIVKALYQKNNDSVMMKIKSSPEHGYVIDYDQKFLNYFINDLNHDGWERLRKENPLARAYVTISQPVYDPKSGIIMIYIGRQGDWLMGSGQIIAFRYLFGHLIEINSITVWIS